MAFCFRHSVLLLGLVCLFHTSAAFQATDILRSHDDPLFAMPLVPCAGGKYLSAMRSPGGDSLVAFNGPTATTILNTTDYVRFEGATTLTSGLVLFRYVLDTRYQIWVTDCTVAGTHMLNGSTVKGTELTNASFADLDSVTPFFLIEGGARAVFSPRTQDSLQFYYVTDGTVAGTAQWGFLNTTRADEDHVVCGSSLYIRVPGTETVLLQMVAGNLTYSNTTNTTVFPTYTQLHFVTAGNDFSIAASLCSSAQILYLALNSSSYSGYRAYRVANNQSTLLQSSLLLPAAFVETASDIFYISAAPTDGVFQIVNGTTWNTTAIPSPCETVGTVFVSGGGVFFYCSDSPTRTILSFDGQQVRNLDPPPGYGEYGPMEMLEFVSLKNPLADGTQAFLVAYLDQSHYSWVALKANETQQPYEMLGGTNCRMPAGYPTRLSDAGHMELGQGVVLATVDIANNLHLRLFSDALTHQVFWDPAPGGGLRVLDTVSYVDGRLYAFLWSPQYGGELHHVDESTGQWEPTYVRKQDANPGCQWTEYNYPFPILVNHSLIAATTDNQLWTYNYSAGSALTNFDFVFVPSALCGEYFYFVWSDATDIRLFRTGGVETELLHFESLFDYNILALMCAKSGLIITSYNFNTNMYRWNLFEFNSTNLNSSLLNNTLTIPGINTSIPADGRTFTEGYHAQVNGGVLTAFPTSLTTKQIIWTDGYTTTVIGEAIYDDATYYSTAPIFGRLNETHAWATFATADTGGYIRLFLWDGNNMTQLSDSQPTDNDFQGLPKWTWNGVNLVIQGQYDLFTSQAVAFNATPANVGYGFSYTNSFLLLPNGLTFIWGASDNANGYEEAYVLGQHQGDLTTLYTFPSKLQGSPGPQGLVMSPADGAYIGEKLYWVEYEYNSVARLGAKISQIELPCRNDSDCHTIPEFATRRCQDNTCATPPAPPADPPSQPPVTPPFDPPVEAPVAPPTVPPPVTPIAPRQRPPTEAPSSEVSTAVIAGAVVGGVIGGGSIIALVAYVIYRIRRGRRSNIRTFSSKGQTDGGSEYSSGYDDSYYSDDSYYDEEDGEYDDSYYDEEDGEYDEEDGEYDEEDGEYDEEEEEEDDDDGEESKSSEAPAEAPKSKKKKK